MLTLPTTFPSDAVSDGLVCIETGIVTTQPRRFYQDVWNVGGFAGGLLLHDGAANPNKDILNPEQRDQLNQLASRIRDLQPSLDSHVTAHKLGDGTLLGIILKYLPILLQLLGQIGIGLPAPPTT